MTTQIRDSSNHDSLIGKTADPGKVRPWLRLWARSVDMTVWMTLERTVLIIILKILFDPQSEVWSDDSPVTVLESLIFAVSYFFSYSIIEAVTLALWGTTPARRLLGIHISTVNGDKLGFGQSFSRCLDVWIRGWACGLSILALGSLGISYIYTRVRNVAPWDNRLGLVVHHDQVKLTGFLMTVGLFVVATIVGIIITG